MTLPFENDTRRIIHGLAKADLKTHKLKNIFNCNHYRSGHLSDGNYFFGFSE